MYVTTSRITGVDIAFMARQFIPTTWSIPWLSVFRSNPGVVVDFNKMKEIMTVVSYLKL